MSLYRYQVEEIVISNARKMQGELMNAFKEMLDARDKKLGARLDLIEQAIIDPHGAAHQALCKKHGIDRRSDLKKAADKAAAKPPEFPFKV